MLDHVYPYIWSSSLSLLLLLAASVAIRISKRRQRRALREQYENIPDEGIDQGALLTENKY